MKFIKERLFGRTQKNKINDSDSNNGQPLSTSPATEHNLSIQNHELEFSLQETFEQAASEVVTTLQAFLINQEHFSPQVYPDFLLRIFSAFSYELHSPNPGILLEKKLTTYFVHQDTKQHLLSQIKEKNKKKYPPNTAQPTMHIAQLNHQLMADQIADVATTLDLMLEYTYRSSDLGHIFPTGIQTQFELSDHPITHGSIVSQTFSGIDFYQENHKTISVPQIITTSLLFFDAKLPHSWEQELYRRGAANVDIRLDSSIEVTEANGNKTKYRRFVSLEKSEIPSLLELQHVPTVRANRLDTINPDLEPDQDDFYYVFIAYERSFPNTRQERTSQRKQPDRYTQPELIPNKKRT